ncbi:M1 family metallopeptidase [Nonomuraea sediminis]|uniref:M1 family metallopeptidase n=1 Tax=Nonomuraea sediminis TaxID=2835864 RepID=UPI0027DEE7B4|nr:M1 family metallopeptidase [Nonomuraea sediminis]
MGSNRHVATMAVALVSVLACSPSTGATASGGAAVEAPHRKDVGAPGIGDKDFPDDGNGGYDVAHYGLKIEYEPESKHLTGVASIYARATQRLDAFNLDLSGLEVGGISVDGKEATYSRSGSELTVRPAAPLADGARFTIQVSYSGVPKPINDPKNLGLFGFVPTDDGAFVACQPDGAKTWFPSNDHPADKATFDFEITVPKGVTALANGEMPRQPATEGDKTTFYWREKHPMVTYLATATMGKFSVRQGRTPGGIPVLAAVDPKFKKSLSRLYTTSAAVTDYFGKVFGPYPFSSTGGIVDDFNAGYALENQTKPIYGGFDPDESIIAHELAHEWYGDSVSIQRWKDLWLNEGFATYAEWLWAEHKGTNTADALFKGYYERPSSDAMWKYPPGRAQPRDLFNESVYTRGGMTLHVLRKTIGDATFFKLLKEWAAEHRYGNATTAQFIALAEKLSGKDLGSLFNAWLFQPKKPAPLT